MERFQILIVFYLLLEVGKNLRSDSASAHVFLVSDKDSGVLLFVVI